MNRPAFFAVVSFALASLISTACDMTYIPLASPLSMEPGSRDISQDERDELERSGHFLKLTSMPANTQITNVSSAHAANSVAAIAKLNQKDPVRIFRDAHTSTVYLPLVYNDDSEFTETGSFYVAFVIHVDALTTYVVDLADKVIVPFTDGRGQLDVRTLPVFGQGNSSPDLTENERDELERSGHFLKLTSMPLHTQNANVASVQIANSSAAIAKLNQKDPVRIFRDADTCTVYLPLVYNNDSEFTETGSFYAAFAIYVDALTTYIVNIADKVIVPFTDGRGQLDVRTLPVPSPDLTENERDELERSGHFLKLTSMPLHTQSANVVSVQIANSVSAVASLDKNQSVRIFRDTHTCTVYLPLAYFDNTEFTETGSFYAAFAIHVDAVTSYVVTVTDKILVPFTDGRGVLDVHMLPYGGIVAADRRYLTIYNLPLYLLPQNVSNVFIHNRYGPVALCGNYALVDVSTSGRTSSVSIPLSFVNSANTAFSGTGSFYVAFELFIDALTHYTVTAEDHVLVYFLNGNGYLDINDLPATIAAEHRYLTITNLPPNLIAQNVANVTIHNQSTSIAKCENYDLLEVSLSGGTASVRIPLSFSNPPSVFTGTGNFFVAFNINIDADTSYIVTAQDKVPVFFLNGNGTLNINDIPSKPVPTLTIKSLPFNTKKHHISDVNVYNYSGVVASCADYNKIEISTQGGSVTASIPLSSSNGGYFMDTGHFAVTFTLNVDVETHVLVSRQYDIVLYFTNGDATFDLNSTYGFFEASLANPSDTALPIIKAGSKFDINGFLHTVTGNLPVPASPPGNFLGLIYLYAYRDEDRNEVHYEFSPTKPVNNPVKKGYYNGSRRALWKMVYVREENNNFFLFKTYINDDFPHLGHKDISTIAFNGIAENYSPQRNISGASNTAAETVTLTKGVYAVRLVGAGGGGGSGLSDEEYNIVGPSSGGAGGSISEIITLNADVAFTAFTGSGGSAAATTAPTSQPDPPELNTFLFAALVNSAWGPIGFLQPLKSGGGAGGGGGSGTFLFSDQGFFLCAGGGGGGSGASFSSPGGAGGSGGAVGPGAGGGAAGYLEISQTAYLNGIPIISSLKGFLNIDHGGNGGGFNAGSGGQCTAQSSDLNGKNAAAAPFLFANAAVAGGTGTPSFSKDEFFNSSYINSTTISSTELTASDFSGSGGSAPAISHDYSPDNQSNTNGANGAGAPAPVLRSPSFSGYFAGDPPVLCFIITSQLNPGRNGLDGGNNRTNNRGDGASGGRVTGNLPNDGSPGFIIIYKIYE